MGPEYKEEFKRNLPDHLSEDEKEEAYAILTSKVENLNNFIDSTIDEMSSMAAGSIEGPGGGRAFGPPNNYNPYKKRNPNKRAKVKRAKRQRRR